MAEVELSGVVKRFGATEVVRGIDLHFAPNEFVIFVGPSGCGKTTLLRMIAGLEEVTAGEIRIQGRRINEVQPDRRGVAMVFQSYALYPHMTVYDNMAFGLRMARLNGKAIRERVNQAASTLQIGELLTRLPRELSGGQKQRVAIGRAIVREPKVFLFDEPLSNLDAALRTQMRLELARLRHKIAATMIYVTHDQMEAMTLADRIVVMRSGVVEQVGSPKEIYESPATLFVAGFIGLPKMNFLETALVGVEGRRASVRLPQGRLMDVVLSREGVHPGQTVTLGIRPENLRLGPDEGMTLGGTVFHVEFLGGSTYVHLEIDDEGKQPVMMTTVVQGDPSIARGERLVVSFKTSECHLFDEGGRLCT